MRKKEEFNVVYYGVYSDKFGLLEVIPASVNIGLQEDADMHDNAP